jgi:translation initiation factor 3 subunit I
MRPIALKGHERSITCLKYNKEGDLIFTSAKSPAWTVWYSDNGERLGTYDGHTGAVWSISIDRKLTLDRFPNINITPFKRKHSICLVRLSR